MIQVLKEQGMATKEYKPGDTVEHSGIYRVLHDNHAEEHEVTCVYGKKFPPCHDKGCHPRFVVVKLAQHIEHNEHFK
jgi:hypothetical protein